MQAIPTSRDTIAPMRHARWAASPWPAPMTMRLGEDQDRRWYRLLDQGQTLGYAVTLPPRDRVGATLIEFGWLPTTAPPGALIKLLRDRCGVDLIVVRDDDPWRDWWGRQGLATAWRRSIYATQPGLARAAALEAADEPLTPLDATTMAAALCVLGQGPALTPRGGDLPEWRLREMAERRQALTLRESDVVRVLALWESLAAGWAVIRVLVAPEFQRRGVGARAARAMTEHLARRGRRVLAILEPNDEVGRKLARAAGMTSALEELGYEVEPRRSPAGKSA